MKIWIHRHNNDPRDDVNAEWGLNYKQESKNVRARGSLKSIRSRSVEGVGSQKLKAVAAALLEYIQYTSMQDEVPKP